jgi:thiol-disulfide isomerase/thioredoxin
MSSQLRPYIVALTTSAVVVAAFFAVQYLTAPKLELAPPEPAPDFVLSQRLDGKAGAIRLSDFQGHPVILSFWASWCDACKEEQALLKELRGRPGHRVSIATGDEQPAAVGAALKRSDDFSHGFDEGNRVSGLYRLSGVPTTILVDSRGQLIHRWNRQLRATDLPVLIRHLEGKPLN